MGVPSVFRLLCVLLLAAVMLGTTLFVASRFMLKVPEKEPGAWNPARGIEVTTELTEDNVRRRQYATRIADGVSRVPDRKAIEEVQSAILENSATINFGWDVDTFFVYAEGTNPRDLLRYFTIEAPNVRPGSEFETGKGVQLSIGRIDWIDETTIEVPVGMFWGPLGASHSIYRILRVGGVWVIAEKRLIRLS